jgi:hypothetical protein
MQKKLSKAYLAEAVREVLLSVPDSDREAFPRTDCEQRVREEYGDFNTDDFSVSWTNVHQQMRLREPAF